ncbi:hypothetical protein [Rhodovulum sulfidophilum]|uniref:hypothetical protein n=1 Tax=Rhodovulum sulfidophilum TaxID=35806 RepID=UPI00398C675C
MKKTLWVRTIARTVEIFHEGQRVASHVRTSGNAQAYSRGHAYVREPSPLSPEPKRLTGPTRNDIENPLPAASSRGERILRNS